MLKNKTELYNLLVATETLTLLIRTPVLQWSIFRGIVLYCVDLIYTSLIRK